MIYPSDYRQRLQKQQKSREYKAMLDQQIRQKQLYSNQQRRQGRYNRMRTQPIASSYLVKQPVQKRYQLRHQSRFLPVIPTNIISQNYRYFPSKQVSVIPSVHYSPTPYKQSDQQLQKCLIECDELINGISRSFIKINNQIGGTNKLRNQRPFNYNSNFSYHNKNKPKDDVFNNYLNHYQTHKETRTSLPTNDRRIAKRTIQIQDDVGRNQMMNYNITKNKNRQGHQNYMSEMKGSRTRGFIISPKSAKKSDFTQNKSTKRTYTKSPSVNQFDPNNQELNASSDHLSGSIIKQKQELTQKQKQKIQAQKQLKIRDKNIIEHLKIARTRGTLLFKKIQLFKKQRQNLQEQYTQNKQQQKKSQRVMQKTNNLPTQTNQKQMPIQTDKRQKAV